VNTKTDLPLANSYASSHVAKAMQSVQAAVAHAEADPERPIYHFLPPANWMNDPNGPIYYNGWYHLFYQHNPFGDDWGYMHWGHARSRDLVHWEHMPIALPPAYEAGEEHVYSGCARVNESGELLLVYTSVKTGTREDRPNNEQWAARPLDAELITWERHPANPVLALETHGGPAFHKEWRDPFIFTADGRSFLVLAGETEDTLEVALYEAVDGSLTRWQYRGPLVREPRVDRRRFLECPNFVQAPPSEPGGKAKWILLTSPYNFVEYTTGEFDMGALTFTPEQHGILDAGHSDVPNFYATNVLDDAAGNCVLLGWARGFAKERGWAGALTLPRLLTVAADGKPRQQPLPALQSLRGRQTSLKPFTVENGSMVAPGVGGAALEIQATLRLEPPAGSGLRMKRASAAGLRVRSSGDGQRGIEIRWDGSTLTVAGSAAALPAEPGSELTLDIFLDKSLLEVFANGGRVAMTRIIYPPAGDLAVEVFAEQGTAYVDALAVWEMKGIW
jgi:sucrose-6-phosphate hydrolase SacC (GH32 family)